MQPTPELETLPENNTKLSVAEQVIVKNYGLYYELKAKYEAFQNWVKQQKDLNP
jgi:hypothetical protein